MAGLIKSLFLNPADLAALVSKRSLKILFLVFFSFILIQTIVVNGLTTTRMFDSNKLQLPLEYQTANCFAHAIAPGPNSGCSFADSNEGAIGFFAGLLLIPLIIYAVLATLFAFVLDLVGKGFGGKAGFTALLKSMLLVGAAASLAKILAYAALAFVSAQAFIGAYALVILYFIYLSIRALSGVQKLGFAKSGIAVLLTIILFAVGLSAAYYYYSGSMPLPVPANLIK
ncbi:hypothetical protein HY993_00840 [Candidatus Micrarchaeota archaeon]|nr:hypothetical protein [Candidatus Micrarchaeota archaeon]